ncbi:MAG: hypothetical protein ABI641_16410 [Caldimonas sp.]
MIHPLLRLIATEPHLLGEHVEAYADLIGEEVGKVTTSWATRLGLYVGALCFTCIGLVLAGVALMLWATLPSSAFVAGWLLWVVPLVPLAGAAVCALTARSRPLGKAFDTVKQQLTADMAMLREVNAA